MASLTILEIAEKDTIEFLIDLLLFKTPLISVVDDKLDLR